MAEHQPQSPTEEILVFKMAENFVLNKRASHYLAVHTMYNEGPHGDEEDADEEDETKQISLYLRYYTTTDRAFNRNLFDLRKLQKERREQASQIGNWVCFAKRRTAPRSRPKPGRPGAANRRKAGSCRSN